MRVFMLGWEFPPHISGGLGTACFGMTKGLDEIGVDVCFVLPTAIPVGSSSHVALRGVATAPPAATVQVRPHLAIRQVEAVLQPYGTPASFEKRVQQMTEHERVKLGLSAQKVVKDVAATPRTFLGGPAAGGAHYGGNLMEQVFRYARLAVDIAMAESFDVIHAHDWMTYPAGLAVAAATGKPLVVHVHSTEFDRSGEHINQAVYELERAGMHGADRVVCVSNLTRNIVLSRYSVARDKVTVVYNAVEPSNGHGELSTIRRDEKIVLFLGRVTMQKGPEYFLQAAKKVVEKFTNVRFVMAGSGDMITQCIRLAADLKIGRYVTFTGFLHGADVDKVFSMADLYVMPSVSEPFGIAPLEALSHNVPVIISKSSGVSEVLTHALKVDFWDIDEMANKILAVLRHAPLGKTLRQHGQIELQKFSWRDSAQHLAEIYGDLVAAAH